MSYVCLRLSFPSLLPLRLSPCVMCLYVCVCLSVWGTYVSVYICVCVW